MIAPTTPTGDVTTRLRTSERDGGADGTADPSPLFGVVADDLDAEANLLDRVRDRLSLLASEQVRNGVETFNDEVGGAVKNAGALVGVRLRPKRQSAFGGGDSVVDILGVRDRGRSDRLARRRVGDRRATALAGGPPTAIDEEFAVVHRVSCSASLQPPPQFFIVAIVHDIRRFFGGCVGVDHHEWLQAALHQFLGRGRDNGVGDRDGDAGRVRSDRRLEPVYADRGVRKAGMRVDDDIGDFVELACPKNDEKGSPKNAAPT